MRWMLPDSNVPFGWDSPKDNQAKTGGPYLKIEPTSNTASTAGAFVDILSRFFRNCGQSPLDRKLEQCKWSGALTRGYQK